MSVTTVALLLADPIGGPEARRQAQQELGRPEYHRDDRSLIQRFLDWLADRVDGAVGGHGPGPALLIVVLLIAAVIGIALWRAGKLPGRRRRQKQQDEDLLSTRTGTDHAAVAAGLEAEGRWADALREWLRAAVQTLESRSLLDPVPGRTGTRTAREAAERLPGAAAPLTAATTAFEQVWFGGRAATEADAAVARAAARAVTDARPARAEATAGFALPR